MHRYPSILTLHGVFRCDAGDVANMADFSILRIYYVVRCNLTDLPFKLALKLFTMLNQYWHQFEQNLLPMPLLDVLLASSICQANHFRRSMAGEPNAHRRCITSTVTMHR